MSSLRRTINQSAREGTSMRRHALSGPTTKSMKNVTHANAVPASPLRYRTKYELRSISLEGNKVLPWTASYHDKTRFLTTRTFNGFYYKDLVESIKLVVMLTKHGHSDAIFLQQYRADASNGTAISDFGASLFIINPFAIGLGRVSAAALLCQADQSRSCLTERKSTAASRW
ncbi:hypothetical protein EAG_07941 [Camponotus floridanus]|uniref:Uncharacterized protein n=1 Tax=Camponotus floridanus TaxID=104421 RepID=E1ZXF6_CAMFO|nr:hypothetical protein EAG_07941 [Camponotus floridanus]